MLSARLGRAGEASLGRDSSGRGTHVLLMLLELDLKQELYMMFVDYIKRIHLASVLVTSKR